MTDTLVFWVGNRSPAITQVISADGTPVNLSGATVVFRMRPVGSSDLKVDAAAAFVTDGTDGQVKYEWAALDVDTAGNYLVWWVVTQSGETQDVSEAVIEFREHAPAVQPAYVELEVAKKSLELMGQTYADTDLGIALLASARTIEEGCGRRFWLDEDNTSVRVYTPDSHRMLEIDDIVDVQTVKIDRTGDGTFEETWTLGTQFVLGPDNAPLDFKPWTTITVRQTGGYYYRNYSRYCLPRGCSQSVQVTGQFGWPTVPSDIQLANSILASKFLKRVREAPFGVVFSEGLDSSSAVRLAKTDPDVGPIIAKYTRHRPFI